MIMFIFGLLCVGAMFFVGLVLIGWTMAYPLSMVAAVLFFPTVWWLAGVWQASSDKKRQAGMRSHPTHASSLDDPLDGLR